MRAAVEQVSGKLGRTLTFVVGKPGLDGHSNGAEQIAVRAADFGMEVVYDGIRLTPAEIVQQAREANAHVVGLSILSGSHVSLVREMVQRMREAGLGDVPVVVGGIIPPEDVNVLKQCGASAIYTPKDFQLNDIMLGIVKLVDAKAEALAGVSVPVPPLRGARESPAVSPRSGRCLRPAHLLVAAEPAHAADQRGMPLALRPSLPAAGTSSSKGRQAAPGRRYDRLRLDRGRRLVQRVHQRQARGGAGSSTRLRRLHSSPAPRACSSTASPCAGTGDTAPCPGK